MRIRRRATGAIFLPMTESLKVWLNGDMSMAKLSQFAQSLATCKRRRIDRLSKRTKEGLICWLCETAPELAVWARPDVGIATIPVQTRVSTLPAVVWPTLRVEEQTDEGGREEAEVRPQMQFPRLTDEPSET
jgi:hypothetical protein